MRVAANGRLFSESRPCGRRGFGHEVRFQLCVCARAFEADQRAPAPRSNNGDDDGVDVRKSKRQARFGSSDCTQKLTRARSWVGRRVIVADNGAHGRIVKSGHGFFTVQASNGEEFMRRKEDLQMLDDADAIVVDDAEPPGIGSRKPKKLPKRRAQVRLCSLVLGLTRRERR